MHWEVDFHDTNCTRDAIKSLRVNGFAVLNNFFTTKQFDNLLFKGKNLKKNGRENELINFAYSIVEKNLLHTLADLYFEKECCFSGNSALNFSIPPKQLKEIQNYDLKTVKSIYTEGARRGLHHDLHGMGKGPFSFGPDSALYKLIQDDEVYGVLRALIFLTDHNNSSGTIQFLRKKTANEYYLGEKSYSAVENMVDIERSLINPNIKRNSILLFNKSTIHSARALRRTSYTGMSSSESGLHPLNELKSIYTQSGTRPYPTSRNILTWDYVINNDQGERLITNTVFMYTFKPTAYFWLGGKQDLPSLLKALSKRIYDVAPLLVTHELYEHKRIRLDLAICASVLYASICKLMKPKDKKHLHTAANNCNILIEHPQILEPFTEYYDYSGLIMELAKSYLSGDLDQISSIFNYISKFTIKLLRSKSQHGRTSILYNDNDFQYIAGSYV